MNASCRIPNSDNQLIDGAIVFVAMAFFTMVAPGLAYELTALIDHEKRAPRSSSHHGG